MQQPDGTWTVGNRRNLGKNQVEDAFATQRSNKSNWGEPGDLVNVAAKAAANVVDFAKPGFRAVTAIGNERDTNTLALPTAVHEYNLGQASEIDQITDADQEMYRGILKDNRHVAIGGKTDLTAEEQTFWDSPKREILSDLRGQVSANIHDAKVIDRSANAFRKSIHASGLDEKIKKDWDKNYKKDGFFGAAFEMVKENPLHAVEELAASLPIMLAAMTGIGLLEMYHQKSE